MGSLEEIIEPRTDVTNELALGEVISEIFGRAFRASKILTWYLL